MFLSLFLCYYIRLRVPFHENVFFNNLTFSTNVFCTRHAFAVVSCRDLPYQNEHPASLIYTALISLMICVLHLIALHQFALNVTCVEHRVLLCFNHLQ